jgi:hypothetical protein
MLRKTSGPKWNEVTGGWQFCTPHHMLLGRLTELKSIGVGGACCMYAEEGEMHTAFWWGNLNEGDDMEAKA